MTMKQKKRTEAERNMEENRRKNNLKLLLAEIGIMLAGTAGVFLIGMYDRTVLDRLLANCVMTAVGLAVIGYQLRRGYLRGELDYDNNEHPFRFLLCVCIGLVVVFACGFLPVGGWPFLTVFVMLALFGNMSTGILASSVLLVIAVLVEGAAINGFVLYFISGCFAITLFRQLENDFKIGIPLLLSMLCLLVCETANVVLLANARPDVEAFVIPVANVIISSILLVGCLKLFSSMVIYKYRERYLEINDTENPVLTELKANSREAYFLSIHTAYFCERIGKKLGLDTDVLKCAGYYHRIGEKLPEIMEEKQFPPQVKEILLEYQKQKSIKNKETAVLLCSDLVVASITQLVRISGDKPVDYEAVIDALFKRLLEEGRFWNCNITMREFRVMQQTFREEKLYYDFLR